MELRLRELQGDACGKAELQSAHTVSGGDQQQPCRMFPAQCLSRPADANRGRGGTRFPEHLRDLKAVSERGVRHSPIVGVVLTSGDLDQVLGLLHLRELEPIHNYATASVRRLLREQNIFFNMLTEQPWQSVWTDLGPGERFTLVLRKCDILWTQLDALYFAYVEPGWPSPGAFRPESL